MTSVDIRRADDRVVQTIRVVVLEHRADALLEVGRGHDLAIFSRGQADSTHLATRWLNDEVGDVEPVSIEPIGRKN